MAACCSSPHLFRGLVAVALAALLVGGSCSEPSVVKSLPLDDKFQPVFETESSAEAAPALVRRGFLDSGIFLAASVNLDEFLAAPQLKSIRWEDLEQSLGKWLGAPNSRLSDYRRAWLLLDQSATDISAIAAADKPEPFRSLAFVLERKEDLSPTFWKALPPNPSPTQASDLIPLGTSGLYAAQLDTTHLILGGRELVGRLRNPTGGGKLQVLATDEKLARSLNVFIDPQPISGILNTAAQMSKQFGVGDATQPLLSISQVEITGDLSDDDLFHLTLVADDTKAIDQLATSLSEGISGKAGNGLGGFPGFGAFGGNGMTNSRRSAQLSEWKAGTSLQTFLDDVQKQGLTETTKAEKQVDLRVKRAASFDPLLVDLVHDLQQLISQTQRTANLQTLAKAMAAYEKKTGQLPGNMLPGKSGTQVSHPFSWRVALLPYLGHQDLFDRIDFSQPWDSETNQKLADAMPAVFGNQARSGVTSLALAIGERFTFVPGQEGATPVDSLTDPRNRTALVVELAPGQARSWLAPDGPLPPPNEEGEYGLPEELGVLWIDAEFRVRGIRRSSMNLEAILTRAGNEKVDRQDLIQIDAPSLPTGTSDDKSTEKK